MMRFTRMPIVDDLPSRNITLSELENDPLKFSIEHGRVGEKLRGRVSRNCNLPTIPRDISRTSEVVASTASKEWVKE
jgi:hypothetical protein